MDYEDTKQARIGLAIDENERNIHYDRKKIVQREKRESVSVRQYSALFV